MGDGLLPIEAQLLTCYYQRVVNMYALSAYYTPGIALKGRARMCVGTHILLSTCFTAEGPLLSAHF